MAANDAHLNLLSCVRKGNTLNVYLGLPWATFIDKNIFPKNFFSKLRIRISGMKGALNSLGLDLSIHTVCQHIYWDKCSNIWSDLGLTDLWLSHMELGQEYNLPFRVHPWSLYAVNVLDIKRKAGIAINIHPSHKQYLASFIGTNASHYLTDARKKLNYLKDHPLFHIENTENWHFNDVVYKHQVNQLPLSECYQIGDSVYSYNVILSNSKFVLCPSGAGPNTLRFWESLAVGSIPVLLGRNPVLPEGGSLARINWDDIVIKIHDKDINHIPDILSKFTIDEISFRQQKCIEAFNSVLNQTCF